MVDIEITYDPREYEVVNGAVLDDTFYRLPDGEWIRHARRVTGRDDLVICYHVYEDSFVLCQMRVDSDVKVVSELHAMPEPPDRGGWLPDQLLIMKCRPDYVKVREIRESRRAAKYKERFLKRESEEQRQSVIKHMKNQGMGAQEANWAMSTNRYVGDVEGGESLAEQRERLTDAGKKKVYNFAQQ